MTHHSWIPIGNHTGSRHPQLTGKPGSNPKSAWQRLRTGVLCALVTTTSISQTSTACAQQHFILQPSQRSASSSHALNPHPSDNSTSPSNGSARFDFDGQGRRSTGEKAGEGHDFIRQPSQSKRAVVKPPNGPSAEVGEHSSLQWQPRYAQQRRRSPFAPPSTMVAEARASERTAPSQPIATKSPQTGLRIRKKTVKGSRGAVARASSLPVSNAQVSLLKPRWSPKTESNSDFSPHATLEFRSQDNQYRQRTELQRPTQLASDSGAEGGNLRTENEFPPETARPAATSGSPKGPQIRLRGFQRPASGSEAEDPTETLQDDSQRRRKMTAELISNRILAGQKPPSELVAPPAQTSIPGWQAVGERCQRSILQAQSLLSRRAILSARAEAEEASLYLMRVLDSASNSFSSEPAWHAAREALKEADSFVALQQHSADHQSMRLLVDSHSTPVLKDVRLEQVSPMAAAQHYRDFAVEQLKIASQGHPWAAEIYYCIGRTFQHQAEQQNEESEGLIHNAITFYQAAFQVKPNHAAAANQLGFLLLKMDQPRAAQEILKASLTAGRTQAGLQNLIHASRRLGDQATLKWAWEQYQQNAAQQKSTPKAPNVVEVDPSTFAAMSPPTIGPSPTSEK